MATIKTLEVGKHVDPFYLKEIPDLLQKVDFEELIAAVIGGGMKFLTRPGYKDNPREYILIVNGIHNGFYNAQPACYMSLKRKKSQPTACGRFIYCDYKRYSAWSVYSDIVFPYIAQEINYYDDYGRKLTAESEPFKINDLDIIDAAFLSLYDRIVKTNKIITTFSEYALVYTKDTYDFPVLEIHHC